MYLSSIDYEENRGESNFWEIKSIKLKLLNLIVGINATGKTRLVNVISNFARIIQGKVLMNGNFKFCFRSNTDQKKEYTYLLEIKNGIIEQEKISSSEKVYVERKRGIGRIFSEMQNKLVEYNPPENALTFNVRRDLKDHSFLEDFIQWGNSFLGYAFSGVKTNVAAKISDPELALQNLTFVPYILKEIIQNQSLLKNIIKDMIKIGYPVESINVIDAMSEDQAIKIPVAIVKETNLKCQTEQVNMSQGMFRALCIIVILEYLINKQKYGTIIIDDLGEGLDYDRSTQLTKLLFDKLKGSNLQLIITSNDRFLINNVDLVNINFLKRDGHTVTALNYENSKELFEDFKETGLNNFDLFTSGSFN